MKNLKLVTIFLSFILLLCACGSTPDSETQYFVLNPNHSNVKISSFPDNIRLQPIQLAKFLDQPGIVLQTDQHEIKVAHYHRWAEPLKHNLYRYISQSIGINNTSDASQTLEVHIQNFQGTAEGNALLSGYWESDEIKQSFNFKAPLIKPGYSELVKQLAVLLDQLSADIAAQIN